MNSVKKAEQVNQDFKSLARSMRFTEAVAALEGIDFETSDPDMLNDLAVARWMTGDLDAAIELLDMAVKKPGHSVLAVLNLFYLDEVKKIRQSFDFKLKHKNHDGLDESGEAPRVSVIVRTCNRRDLLKDALNSLGAQTFRDFETIVVNDGGDREIEDVVKAATAPGIRYFYAPHGGPWSAMNYGLEMARGEFITFLDDDDMVSPEHIEVLLACLESRDDRAAAYPDARVSIWRPSADGAYEKIRLIERKTRNFKKTDFFRTNYINSVLIMVRKTCFEEAGKFCAVFPSGGDWEMWLRLSEKFKFYHLSRFTAEIRIFEDKERVTKKGAQDKYRWDNLLLFMHRGLPLFSFSRRPEHERAYRMALRELDRLLKVVPDIQSRINLRGLWTARHPYAYFTDQAKWFLKINRPADARLFACAARKLRWYEPKPIMIMLRMILPRKKGAK